MASKRGRGARKEPASAGLGPERIQKILARAGYGSRRACEVLILEGRVRVDGEIVTELGSKADIETQELAVDGKRVVPERPVYYLLNKPKGTLCTLSDPEGRRTVQHHFEAEHRRIFPVGRLDMDSRGAVILTNDGRFTNLLTHPRYGVEKTYSARVRGFVDDGSIMKLRAGVWLAEGKTLPARVWVVKRKADETEIGMAICEGKNRQVRRMLAAVGFKCQALTRTRVGPITLKGLREGDYRELSRDEVEELEKIAKRNAGAPPPPWAKGRSSRARSLGKPNPFRPAPPELGEAAPADDVGGEAIVEQDDASPVESPRPQPSAERPRPPARSRPGERPRSGERPRGPRRFGGDRPSARRERGRPRHD